MWFSCFRVLGLCSYKGFRLRGCNQECIRGPMQVPGFGGEGFRVVGLDLESCVMGPGPEDRVHLMLQEGEHELE